MSKSLSTNHRSKVPVLDGGSSEGMGTMSATHNGAGGAVVLTACLQLLLSLSALSRFFSAMCSYF